MDSKCCRQDQSRDLKVQISEVLKRWDGCNCGTAKEDRPVEVGKQPGLDSCNNSAWGMKKQGEAIKNKRKEQVLHKE